MLCSGSGGAFNRRFISLIIFCAASSYAFDCKKLYTKQNKSKSDGSSSSSSSSSLLSSRRRRFLVMMMSQKERSDNTRFLNATLFSLRKGKRRVLLLIKGANKALCNKNERERATTKRANTARRTCRPFLEIIHVFVFFFVFFFFFSHEEKKSDFSITVTPLNSGLTLAAASKLGLYNDTDNNGAEPLSEMSERWTSKRAQKSNNYAF